MTTDATGDTRRSRPAFKRFLPVILLAAGFAAFFLFGLNDYLTYQALVDNRLAEGQRGEITSLVVAAEVRSRGIGAELVAAVTQWLQSRGIGRMRVRCNAVRERAHRFYETHGFELTKTQKVFDIAFAAAQR